MDGFCCDVVAAQGREDRGHRHAIDGGVVQADRGDGDQTVHAWVALDVGQYVQGPERAIGEHGCISKRGE